MRNARLYEAPAGIKIARRNINNLRHPDDTTLMAESKEELKNLLMRVKEESENAGLKLLMLYITSLWLIYFVTGGLYPLFPSSILSPKPFSQAITHFSAHLWVSFCFLDYTYKWKHMIFVFLWHFYILFIYFYWKYT